MSAERSSDERGEEEEEGGRGGGAAEPIPEVMRAHTDKVQALLLSRDGGTLWSAAADKTIIQWDVKTLTIVRTLKGHTGGVKSLVLSPDETTLYSGGADKGIRAWEASSGLWLRTFVGGHSGFVTAMAVSADGRLLFTGCEATYGDGSVKVHITVLVQHGPHVPLRGPRERTGRVAFESSSISPQPFVHVLRFHG